MERGALDNVRVDGPVFSLAELKELPDELYASARHTRRLARGPGGDFDR